MVKKLAMAVGIVLTLVGVLGFVPGVTTDGLLLGIFEVDTIHNIIHLATGVIALLAAMGIGLSSSLFFKVFGVIYALVAVAGLAMGSPILGLVSANMADHVLHVVLAAAFLYIGFGMRDDAPMAMNSMSSNPGM